MMFHKTVPIQVMLFHNTVPTTGKGFKPREGPPYTNFSYKADMFILMKYKLELAEIPCWHVILISALAWAYEDIMFKNRIAIKVELINICSQL